MEPSWIGRIIARDLETLKRELMAFPDEHDIWREVPGLSNTTGTLVLHLAGNLQHFVGALLGGTGYVRNREAEFTRRAVSRAELIAELDRALEAVQRTLGAEARFDWAGSYPSLVGARYSVATGDWLVHLVSHLAYHLGQVDYHRRLVTGQATGVDPVAIPGLATARQQPKAT